MCVCLHRVRMCACQRESACILRICTHVDVYECAQQFGIRCVRLLALRPHLGRSCALSHTHTHTFTLAHAKQLQLLLLLTSLSLCSALHATAAVTFPLSFFSLSLFPALHAPSVTATCSDIFKSSKPTLAGLICNVSMKRDMRVLASSF